MLRLPNDVLLRILKFLYYCDEDNNIYGKKEDLLASRVVCRRLADIGQSLAFEHITVIQDEDDYERILEMSKSLCFGTVRRLTWYFKDFEADPTPEQFARSRGIEKQDWTQEEFDAVYKPYCRSYQYQQLLEDSNVDIASLAVALHRIPLMDF